MQRLKIVARYRDGRVLKGHSDNFNTQADSFLLFPVPATQGPTPMRVSFAELKAAFVVRDFAGQPATRERRHFTLRDAPDPCAGKKIRVQFDDGEILIGTSLNFDPQGQGFFLLPVDEHSNNQRIYVVNSAVKEVKQVA